MIRETLYDRIAGSLMAGALGDALGYEVEFIPWSGIQDRFGGPIRALALNRGFARISDDTQMTLFTGEGLLLGLRRNRERPGSITLTEAIYQAYLCWLSTQYHSELPSSFERDSELLLSRHAFSIVMFRRGIPECLFEGFAEVEGIRISDGSSHRYDGG